MSAITHRLHAYITCHYYNLITQHMIPSTHSPYFGFPWCLCNCLGLGGLKGNLTKWGHHPSAVWLKNNAMIIPKTGCKLNFLIQVQNLSWCLWLYSQLLLHSLFISFLCLCHPSLSIWTSQLDISTSSLLAPTSLAQAQCQRRRWWRPRWAQLPVLP